MPPHCFAAARRLLEQMQQELQQSKFVYRPPWAASSGAGGSSLTGHSNGTYAAFLTPGGLDQRRQAATPTLVSRAHTAGSIQCATHADI